MKNPFDTLLKALHAIGAALLALLGCIIPIDEGADPYDDGYTPPPPDEPRPPETSPESLASSSW